MAIEQPSFDTIFCAAIEIASAEERAAYIAGACSDNTELRERVEKLVAAHFQAGSFMESPVEVCHSPDVAIGAKPSGLAATIDSPISEGAGARIGPYKLLQQIGEGGMGTVWMAEQTEPVRRKVALKVIKPGMDSAQVIARFEAERQALAMMDHPNIAKVLDAGQVGQASSLPSDPRQAGSLSHVGRPYFVMELVKGVTITKYCDWQRRIMTRRSRCGTPPMAMSCSR
jgi:serine/threonine protein kinase